MINIEVGEFYVNEHDYGDGIAEKNIILVVSKSDLEGLFITETLWVFDGNVKNIYSNEWLLEFLKRKATQEEINLFKQERSKIDGQLKGYGQVVTGIKIG